jgi:hypothetical protein
MKRYKTTRMPEATVTRIATIFRWSRRIPRTPRMSDRGMQIRTASPPRAAATFFHPGLKTRMDNRHNAAIIRHVPAILPYRMVGPSVIRFSLPDATARCNPQPGIDMQEGANYSQP